jgi:hypothetical protein
VEKIRHCLQNDRFAAGAGIELVEVSPGYWSVTVAAQVATRTERGWVDTGLHYYRVPIRVLGGPEAGAKGSQWPTGL